MTEQGNNITYLNLYSSRNFPFSDQYNVTRRNNRPEIGKSHLSQLKEIWELGTLTYHPLGLLRLMLHPSFRFNNRRPLAFILHKKADRERVISALTSDYVGQGF